MLSFPFYIDSTGAKDFYVMGCVSFLSCRNSREWIHQIFCPWLFFEDSEWSFGKKHCFGILLHFFHSSQLLNSVVQDICFTFFNHLPKKTDFCPYASIWVITCLADSVHQIYSIAAVWTASHSMFLFGELALLKIENLTTFLTHSVHIIEQENLNSKSYLSAIKVQVLESLRCIQHAPGVQMQEVMTWCSPGFRICMLPWLSFIIASASFLLHFFFFAFLLFF